MYKVEPYINALGFTFSIILFYFIGGDLSMNITDVRVRKVNQEGKMKAIVSITIDNEFVVHDIKVIEGENGLFIAMPSRRTNTGDFKDIAHPINSSSREGMQAAILSKYEEALLQEESMKESAVTE